MQHKEVVAKQQSATCVSGRINQTSSLHCWLQIITIIINNVIKEEQEHGGWNVSILFMTSVNELNSSPEFPELQNTVPWPRRFTMSTFSQFVIPEILLSHCWHWTPYFNSSLVYKDYLASALITVSGFILL